MKMKPRHTQDPDREVKKCTGVATYFTVYGFNLLQDTTKQH